MAGRRTERFITRLIADNPGARCIDGGKHIKVITPDGQLAGILPYSPVKEGYSPGLLRQLRRAGLKITA